MSENLQVANTILAQLGGNRFTMMTGAKHFIADQDGGLSFKLPSNFAKNGINAIFINLTPLDTYRVGFYHVRGLKVIHVAEYDDVYADQLRSIFTAETGLCVSL